MTAIIAETQENWELIYQIVEHIRMAHTLGTYANTSWLWTLVDNLEYQA